VRVVARSFLARRLADEMRQLRDQSAMIVCDVDSCHRLESTSLPLDPADDAGRLELEEDRDGVLSAPVSCLSAETRPGEAVDLLRRCECSESDEAASEVVDDSKMTLHSADIRCGPDVTAALRSGGWIRLDYSLPNLPFIEAFSGVVSRRAVRKVSVILVFFQKAALQDRIIVAGYLMSVVTYIDMAARVRYVSCWYLVLCSLSVMLFAQLQ